MEKTIDSEIVAQNVEAAGAVMPEDQSPNRTAAGVPADIAPAATPAQTEVIETHMLINPHNLSHLEARFEEWFYRLKRTPKEVLSWVSWEISKTNC